MRNIEQHNINEWFFDLVEGNLSKVEESQLYSFIEKNKGYQKDLDLWLGTVYTAPSTIEFPNQASLIRKQNFFVEYGKYLLPILFITSASTFYLLSDNETQNTENKTSIENTVQLKETETTINTEEELINEETFSSPELKNQTNFKTEITPLMDTRSFEEISSLENKTIEFTPSEAIAEKELNFVKVPKPSNVEVASKNSKKKKKSSEADVIEIENSGF